MAHFRPLATPNSLVDEAAAALLSGGLTSARGSREDRTPPELEDDDDRSSVDDVTAGDEVETDEAFGKASVDVARMEFNAFCRANMKHGV